MPGKNVQKHKKKKSQTFSGQINRMIFFSFKIKKKSYFSRIIGLHLQVILNRNKNIEWWIKIIDT